MIKLRNGITIDLEFYRSQYADLKFLNDKELIDHFMTYGENEGRASAKLSRRTEFVSFCASNRIVLELGPFANPAIVGDSVEYFDVLDRDALICRAIEHNLPICSIPEIKYVSAEGDLGCVERKFKAVFSSHNFEHTVNIIEHLAKVRNVLEDDGSYYLIIPDKRYTFDYYMPETTIADVIESEHLKRRFHSLKSIIEHYALTTHNDCIRHWNGDHGDVSLEYIVERVGQAMHAFDLSSNEYIDVHSWKFTPHSFYATLNILAKLNYSPFKKITVFPTLKNQLEFNAILSL